VAFFQSQNEGSANAAHFVPDFGPANPGGLFVVGRVADKWTVQRSRDAGATWTTVDSWVPQKNSIAGALAIASDGAGKIYVLGAPGRTWEAWEWVDTPAGAAFKAESGRSGQGRSCGSVLPRPEIRLLCFAVKTSPFF
jgi:hypothetical protein